MHQQQRVDAIEDAAMAGNEMRAVLHLRRALQHRFEQVADDAERDQREAERAEAHTSRHRRAATGPQPRHRHAPPTNPPTAPSTVFFGLIAGASSVRPNSRPA